MVTVMNNPEERRGSRMTTDSESGNLGLGSEVMDRIVSHKQVFESWPALVGGLGRQGLPVNNAGD